MAIKCRNICLRSQVYWAITVSDKSLFNGNGEMSFLFVFHLVNDGQDVICRQSLTMGYKSIPWRELVILLSKTKKRFIICNERKQWKNTKYALIDLVPYSWCHVSTLYSIHNNLPKYLFIVIFPISIKTSAPCRENDL